MNPYDPVSYYIKHMRLREMERKIQMKSTMNHFIGWKFGVPVRVKALNSSSIVPAVGGLLIYEDGYDFSTVDKDGSLWKYSKKRYRYELIPHKWGCFSPRYPVCENPMYTAFCNSGGQMDRLDTCVAKMQPYPAATLNIDGKTIELSGETVTNLKKELGI